VTLCASNGEAREEISIVLAALWRDSIIVTLAAICRRRRDPARLVAFLGRSL
jgi:hypothetical protein